MVTQWYCKIMGDERGPVTMDELRSMVTSGVLAIDDLVRSDADGSWVRVDAVPGLFCSSATVARLDDLQSGGFELMGELESQQRFSPEFESTDTRASIRWSTFGTPTVSDRATGPNRAPVVRVPHRTLKVGRGATPVGRAEKLAHQSTITSALNAAADTVVATDAEANVEPNSATLPEHRV
jgi:hypothetical protein